MAGSHLVRAVELLRDAIRASEETIERHRIAVGEARRRIAQEEDALAAEQAAKASFEQALRCLEESQAAGD